jgi:hypothetical protein
LRLVWVMSWQVCRVPPGCEDPGGVLFGVVVAGWPPCCAPGEGAQGGRSDGIIKLAGSAGDWPSDEERQAGQHGDAEEEVGDFAERVTFHGVWVGC